MPSSAVTVSVETGASVSSSGRAPSSARNALTVFVQPESRFSATAGVSAWLATLASQTTKSETIAFFAEPVTVMTASEFRSRIPSATKRAPKKIANGSRIAGISHGRRSRPIALRILGESGKGFVHDR